jgi:hypothetical protein
MRRPTGLVIGRPFGRIHAHTQTRQDSQTDETYSSSIRSSALLLLLLLFSIPVR